MKIRNEFVIKDNNGSNVTINKVPLEKFHEMIDSGGLTPKSNGN